MHMDDLHLNDLHLNELALADAPGWYGKLPGLGDFASRRLPAAFVQEWDEWLQGVLAAAREEWGAAWLDRYLVAPIVRFWLGPGVVAGGAWCGLVMPSVDRVGRHFPLSVVQPAGALAQALAARRWYGALDAAARRALDTAFTVDDLERALAAVDAEGPCDVDPAGTDDARLAASLVPPGSVASVWWCDDASAGAVHAFDAMPPPQAFARWLGGPA
jgi:type VI secretion system protein ImpM